MVKITKQKSNNHNLNVNKSNDNNNIIHNHRDNVNMDHIKDDNNIVIKPKRCKKRKRNDIKNKNKYANDWSETAESDFIDTTYNNNRKNFTKKKTKNRLFLDVLI